MTFDKNDDDIDSLEELKKKVVDQIALCRRCRMCVAMCPTYEGWLTQSSIGRLNAINLYFKYGLGSPQELSDLLYACTTCRRCQERCRILAVGANPTDIILLARELLVRKCRSKKDNVS
jgi:Fe-S oxidoreductase